jgi:hypothetical protein
MSKGLDIDNFFDIANCEMIISKEKKSSEYCVGGKLIF